MKHQVRHLCEENLQNIIMNKLGIEGPVEIEQWHQMGYKQQNKSRPLFAVLANLKKSKQCKQIKKTEIEKMYDNI